MTIPSVQTFAAKKGVAIVNNRYDTDIQVSRARYIFPDRVILENVYIRDEEKDTLIYTQVLDARLQSFINNELLSTGVKLIKPRFYYLTKEGRDIDNLKEFVAKFSGSGKKKSPFGLEIGYIELHHGRFRLENLNCDSCFSLNLRNINGRITDFDLLGSYLTGDVEELALKQYGAFAVEEFHAHYEYQAKEMLVEDFEFTTTASYARGNLVMKYDTTSYLQDFVEKVVMIGNIEESSIASTEVQFFSSSFPDFGQWEFSGKGGGLVDDLKSENVVLHFAGGSTFESRVFNIQNSTNTDELYMFGEDFRLSTNPDDVTFMHGLFADTALPSFVKGFGDITITGDFDGYLDRFDTRFHFDSRLGNIIADLQLVLPEQYYDMEYSGNLGLRNFNLGYILNEPDLGKVSTQLLLNGEGLNPQKMKTAMRGSVSSLEFHDYTYHGISVDGRIDDGQFDGKLSILDTNLEFYFNGSTSFVEDTSFHDFNAEIRRSNLYALNLAKDTIASLSAKFDINLTALNFDRWAGDIKVFNLTYENSSHFHFFQDIDIKSRGLVNNRSLIVNSNILNAKLHGNYSLEGMLAAVNAHITKYVKTRKVTPPPKDENFEFDIAVNNANVITDLFFPEFEIDPGTRFTGKYSSETNKFDIDLISPSFNYIDNQLRGLNLSYRGTNEHSRLGFNLNRYVAPNGLVFDSIALSNFYFRDTLNYDLEWILRDSVDSRGNIKGYAIQRDSTTFQLGFYPSGFNYGYEDFIIRGQNEFVIDTGGIHITNFIVANQGRTLSINGNISNNPNEILRLNLRGVDMDIINYLVGYEHAQFKGDIFGDVIVTEILGTPKFAAALRVDSLQMNKTLLGNLSINSDWSVEEDTIHIDTRLVNGELTSLMMRGFYQPDSTGNMNFDIDFDKFRLAAFNPMFDGLAENIRGYLNGSVQVRGTTGRPLINGDISIPRAAFTVSYLQTDYNVVDIPVVKIRPDGMHFPELTIRDTKFGTEGVLTGDFLHTNFRDFRLDLKVDADELLVLNTNPLTQDPAYYGTAFVSGEILMEGPLDNILLSGNLSSRRNTEFYIMMGGATEVDETDFVTFVNPHIADSVQEVPVRELNLSRGVSLDFNLDINQNALVGIIIDQASGSKMEGTGFGNLRVKVDQYSDIEVYGNYTVAEGTYNFVLQDAFAIKRRFDILRGGTLSWNGDPYEALIDITARYRTKADPSILVPEYSGGNTVIYIDMYLSENLLNPSIDFDIKAPRARADVQTVLNTRLADQDAEYDQVFALLTLGHFVGDQGVGSFVGNTGDLGLQILASQAESFLNQYTWEGFNVTLNYEGGTSNTNNNPSDPSGDPTLDPTNEEVEVGGSLDILNDRITLNGVVGVPVGANNQNQLTGDFEIEYDITADGRLRAKAFNRPFQQYSFGQQYYQQGVGIYLRFDFDRIFRRKGDGKREEEEEQKPVEPQNPQIPDDIKDEEKFNNMSKGK